MVAPRSLVPHLEKASDEKRIASFFGFAAEVLQAQHVTTLAKTTYRHLAPLIEAESVYLVGYAEEKQEFWTTLPENPDPRPIHFGVDVPLLGPSFNTGTVINSRHHEPDSWQPALSKLFRKTIYSLLTQPILTSTQHPLGLLVAVNKRNGGEFDGVNENIFSASCQLLASVMDYLNSRQQIQTQHQKLREENRMLRRLLENPAPIPFIAADPKSLDLLKAAEKAATSPVPVLIEGEDGTGKELLANHIHFKSSRMDAPCITLNCAAYPPDRLAEELFGKFHEDKSPQAVVIGKLESGDRGTLYISNIDHMPLSLQESLLHFIQTGEYFPVNGQCPKYADVRIIASSTRQLEHLVAEGRFHRDLYTKLKNLSIAIPPLRERKEDILLLADFFLQETCRKTNKRIRGFEPEVLQSLQAHSWETNIDGLKHHIQQLVAISDQQQWIRTPKLKVDDVPIPKGKKAALRGATLRDQVQAFERKVIEATLNATSGNKTKTAKLLGLTREGLRIKLKKIRREN